MSVADDLLCATLQQLIGHLMAPVIDVTRDDLFLRRNEILHSLGVDADGFRALEETRTLTGIEWEAREEPDAIAFLLGEDS